VIEWRDKIHDRGIASPNLERQCRLTGSWEHERVRQAGMPGDGLPKPIERDRCDEQSVVFAGLKSAQAGVDIAADRTGNKVGPRDGKLGGTSHAARTDARATRQVGETCRVSAEQAVMWIAAFEDRSHCQSRLELGWQVLERVESGIDSTLDQCMFQLAGELSVARRPLSRWSSFADGIANRADLHDLNGAVRPEARKCIVGELRLSKRQPALSSAEPKGGDADSH
jgi:hypothetical protein